MMPEYKSEFRGGRVVRVSKAPLPDPFAVVAPWKSEYNVREI